MRIVHLLTRFVRGGSEENTILSCLGQAASGEDVHLVYGHDWRPESLDKLGAQVCTHHIPSMLHRIHPLRDAIALVHLYRLLSKLRPDVVHTHQSKAGILGRIAARLAGVSAIVHTVHIVPFDGVSPLKAIFYKACEQLCGHFTDMFIHVTPGTQTQFAAQRIGTQALHRVVASGMAVEQFVGAAPADDLGAWRGADSFLIVSLAALEKRKRVGDFLPVFQTIARDHSHALLAIAGEGPEAPVIADRIAKMGLGDRVRLLGFRSDPQALLAAADALVLCSQREGLPRAAIQARIAGVPIVSTALPQIDEVVTPGESGYLVPLDRLGDMAAAFHKLIGNDAMRERLRRGDPPFDSRRWQAIEMTARLTDAYHEALRNSQRGRTTSA